MRNPSTRCSIGRRITGRIAGRIGPRIALIGTVVLLAGAAAALVIAAPPGRADRPNRIDRQVRIAAAEIDETLIDSPNFLVPGRDNARGVYLPGVGAVFTFTATLTGYGWTERGLLGKGFFFGRGNRSIFLNGTGLSVEGLKDLEKLEKLGGLKLSVDGEKGDDKISEKKIREDLAEKYEKGKAELLQAIGDLGDYLSAVPEGETIYLIALLEGVDLPGDRKIGKLTLSAKAGDLRRGLSESGLRSAVEVTEAP